MGKNEELPWDLFDRCLLPVIFSHAAAVILSTILNTLYISQISTFTLFLWFVISSLGAVFFYHNLKVNIFKYVDIFVVVSDSSDCGDGGDDSGSGRSKFS